MATKYALQQAGVADGTTTPSDKADGRQVNADAGVLIASKSTAEAWNSADVIYLGRKPRGNKIVGIDVITGTSTGSATIAVGVGGDPRAGGTVTTADKYAAAAAVTTTDKPVAIGPKAATVDDAPIDDDEHLWATVATDNIAQATALSIVVRLARLH